MMRFLRFLWGARSEVPAILPFLIMGYVIYALFVRVGELERWQDSVARATRDAAHHPKLATDSVPRQIRILGTTIDQTRLAMAKVKAEATAAKLAADTANETRRKGADDALLPTLTTALRSADTYARTGGLRCAPGATPVDRGHDGRSDMPSSSPSAEVSDRSGTEPSMVLVPRSALDTCTTLKVRLDNAHDWALGSAR
jgi:hypothetical protein